MDDRNVFKYRLKISFAGFDNRDASILYFILNYQCLDRLHLKGSLDLNASRLNKSLINQSSFLQSHLLRVTYILFEKAEAYLDLKILLALLAEKKSCLFEC